MVDEIVVVDNGSTDGTFEILQAHPKVTAIVQTQGFNEGRDKNLVYDLARKTNPDWCLWIDVDEIFEPGITRKHLDKMMRSKFITKYGFRRFHFIDHEHFAASKFRLNYTAGHDRIMWKEAPTGYFEDVIIDSPNVKGIRGLRLNTNFRLKHLGYINKDIVAKKASIYRQIIPDKEDTFQQMYLHNEVAVKWIDDRHNFKVIKLNWLLNFIRLKSLVPRVFNKVAGKFKQPKQVAPKVAQHAS